MKSGTLVDMSYEEILEIDGGIGSTEVKLAATICLCAISPWAAVGFALLSYGNTKFIENCIEY